VRDKSLQRIRDPGVIAERGEQLDDICLNLNEARLLANRYAKQFEPRIEDGAILACAAPIFDGPQPALSDVFVKSVLGWRFCKIRRFHRPASVRVCSFEISLCALPNIGAFEGT
jgi:hypothetical protein